MKNYLTYHPYIPYLAAFMLSVIVLVPLTGLPPSVGGIPVWYQDTFLLTLMVMSIVGGITILIFWVGNFKNKSNQIKGYKSMHSINWNRVDFAVGILLLYMAVRIWIEDFPPQSAWIQLTFLGGMYYLTRILWSHIDRKALSFFLSIILIGGIAEAVYGLGQLYSLWPSHHGLFKLTGSFSNPGPYSGWLACVVPVAVFGLTMDKSKHYHGVLRILSIIFLFLGGLVLIPAGSRAALFASFAGVVVILWPSIKHYRFWGQKLIQGTVAAVLIIGLTGLYFLKKDSADGRLLIWKVSADMVEAHPIIGLGWDGFPKMYNNFQALYFQARRGNEKEMYLADSVSFGFNEIMEFTVEMGIVGLSLLLGLIVMVIHKWRRSVRQQNIKPIHFLGLGVLTAWTIFAFFSYPMSIPALALILPVTLSGINTSLIMSDDYTAENKSKQTSSQKTIFANFIVTLLITVASIYSLFWVNHFRPLVKDWVAANAYQDLQRYEMANTIYGSLLPHFLNEGGFLQYAGKSYSLDRQFNASEQILERALFFASDPVIFTTLGKDYSLYSKVKPEKGERADLLLQRSKFISPLRLYPRYLLAKLYTRIGAEQRALGEAEDLLDITPKVSSPATDDIREEMIHMITDQKIIAPKAIILGDKE